MHVNVQHKQRFPQDEVIDMCDAIASEGIMVTKGDKTHTCGAYPLDYDEEGDWVWVTSNLRNDPDVRECLKAIGFRFAGPKSKHPSQWGNSCLKPTRVRRSGKAKAIKSSDKDDDTNTKPTRSALSNPTTNYGGIKAMMDRLKNRS